MTLRERQIMQLIEADPMISQQELADKLGITRSSVAVHISNLMKKGHIAGKGYVLSEGRYVVVVGGVNMDIGGRAAGKLVSEDSNPGKVQMSLGGVGRNIAHNLCLMGTDTRMLTAYGDDLYGQRIGTACAELGIDMRHTLVIPGATTSTYLYITDPEGEMALAVSDMEICDRIAPEYLEKNLQLLNHAQLVITDTNIPEQSIRFLAENVTVPVFCDPVSTAKAVKVAPVLGKLHTLKPNRIEAELLSGVRIRSREDAFRACHRLLGTGLQRIFLSMGSDGVCAASEEGDIWLPTLCNSLVNTTGCGDAFMAGLAWAYLEGATLRESAAAGIAASSIAMESSETINPTMSETALRARMKARLSASDNI